jgi:hypothetical protein
LSGVKKTPWKSAILAADAASGAGSAEGAAQGTPDSIAMKRASIGAMGLAGLIAWAVSRPSTSA